MDREQFEGWISAPPFERSVERQGDNGAWPGQYRSYETQAAWEAWQESAKIERIMQPTTKLRWLAREYKTVSDRNFYGTQPMITRTTNVLQQWWRRDDKMLTDDSPDGFPGEWRDVPEEK